MTTADQVNGDVLALAEELLALQFDAEPLSATLLGLPGHDDRLADVSADAEQATRAAAVDIASRADALDERLGGDVTAKVIAQQAGAVVDRIDARMVEYTVTDIFVGPAASLLTFLPMVVLPDADRAAAYLTRLRAVPAHLAQVGARHRAGVAAGRLPVRRLVDSSIAHLDRYLATDLAADPLLAQRPAVEDQAFLDERERVVAEVVRPAFAAYRQLLVDEIAAVGRPDDRPGLCALPDGEAAYAALSRVHTTTDLSPDELHQTGLDIIAGLRAEYAELGQRVFGTADQAEVFHRLTTDPAMRWRDADELLEHARDAIARAEEAAPRWFGRMPAQACRVEPVPAAEAPGAPAAYYMPPSLDGLRAGVYYANTDRAHERDRFLAEVTAFHEAVPGHHFQLALAMELTELPLLRRLADVNAYAEGWGLYTERLAEEMGLYSDDVARFGMLAMDSMRAGRLVVDTGLHAKGWSRERAVSYLRENTPLSLLEIGNEVDRYIAYPGQALSYMVGRLEIQRARAAAEVRLGADFDIRAFHDLVLGGGPLPLKVLGEVVAEWRG
ncbi:DUF885 domain-containing protein [Actinokineospora auranticolor]|uniref:Uncharacterized protein (DUF885 family) n=1 Tax=Actinokineospora auranticolor TaxID=155976 RepID=A0A2S6GKY9_9PSEU|nr:DUF885 domain-containing protein [Actinokineospora auranticolor]PPK65897.1 uncharacterized protein (DUF885 family) [Actinokineospora auranticolor]